MPTINKAGRNVPWADRSLGALLAAQGLMTFVAIPLVAINPAGHALLDLGHLIFAGVCAVTLTKRRAVRAALLGGLLVLASGPLTPLVWDPVSARLGLGHGVEMRHAIISLTAFVFNALVSLLVARRTFGPGNVTTYRIQGAVLVYLNVAALFAIAFDLLELYSTGVIRTTSGGYLATVARARTAELSYFSLATITTTGYGDLAPVHPLARSLANLEAVFGSLFPATVLARLVSLHLAHTGQGEGAKRRVRRTRQMRRRPPHV